MLAMNSTRVIHSMLRSRLKLQPIQPMPVCDVIELAGLVKVPGKTGFRSPCLHRVPAEREKDRIEDGSRQIKTDLAPNYSVT